MRSCNLSKQISAVVILFLFALLLTACEPTLTPVPPSNAGPASSPVYQGCTISASMAAIYIGQQIIDSKDIFQGEIVKSEPLIWNSADGKAPNEPCSLSVFQYTPVEVHVTESYKGTLKAGDTVRLLIEGAPGAQPYFTFHQFFPQTGQTIIWFLGDGRNFRVGNSETPLVFPNIVEMFNHPAGKDWIARTQMTTFTDTAQLQEFIKNPPPTPTPKFR